MDIKKVSADQAEIKIQSVEKKAQEAPKTQAAADAKTAQTAKKSAPETPKYRQAGGFQTDPGIQGTIARLNSEIRDIEKQKQVYENDLNGLQRKISKATGSDKNAEVVELNAIKASIQEADIERQQKINELKYQMAEGKYQVSGKEIVDRWFGEQ